MATQTGMSLTFVRLPLEFCTERLKADLRCVAPHEWIPHFNDRNYEGDWSGIALRAVGGRDSIYPDPASDASYADTDALARCSYLGDVLAAFECPIGSARLLRLGPGARILEHSDVDLSVDDGTVRLHVPVTTNPYVEFVVAGERVDMREGECWYFDASLPHRVHNRGASDRVHLVFDCRVNEWLKGLMPQHPASRADRRAIFDHRSGGDFESFRRLVLEDVGLQSLLRDFHDRGPFVARAVELGRLHGFVFEGADVESAIRASRKAWFARWI
jgi:hypothetical protein